jgi:diadenosine tetraphosphate (Ap4A) HIT family hydrolase
MTLTDCPLCHDDGGLLLHHRPLYRVVRVTDTPAHPAFYRVTLNAHVSEFSQLTRAERTALMDAVCTVESVLLALLQPAKVNLASLGNVVPHVHWHVIARFVDDAQFPAPIWAPVVRERGLDALQALQAKLPVVDDVLGTRLGHLA